MFFFAAMTVIALFCSFACLYFSIKYWKSPNEITIRPIVLLVIGLVFLCSVTYEIYIVVYSTGGL